MASYKTSIKGNKGMVQFDPMEVDLTHALRTEKIVLYVVAAKDTEEKKADEEFSSVDHLKAKYPKAKYKTVDKGERRIVSDDDVKKHLDMVASDVAAGREAIGRIDKRYSESYTAALKDLLAQHEARLNDERTRADNNQKAHQELMDLLGQIDMRHGGLHLYLPLLHKEVLDLQNQLTELQKIVNAAGGMPTIERYLKDQARRALQAQKSQIDKELAKLG
jgi:hypothetical protein